MFSKLVFLFCILFTFSSWASYQQAENLFQQKNKQRGTYRAIIKELVAAGYYHGVVPLLKEEMHNSTYGLSQDMEEVLDLVSWRVGTRTFQAMNKTQLRSSNSAIISFIRAKTAFRSRSYNEAYEFAHKVKSDHWAYPYALLIRASILTLQKKYEEALDTYDLCIKASKSAASGESFIDRRLQYESNTDFCIVGKARAYYADRKYEKADLAYLDLSKNAYFWPHMLYEEAWNSFYKGDYNRTLGKLVTYRSPFIDFVYNPEVDVLNAYSYLKLCLWDDARKAADRFYSEYQKPAEAVRSLLYSQGQKYKYFFDLALKRVKGEIDVSDLLNRMLKSIVRDRAYQSMMNSFKLGMDEHDRIKNQANSRFQKMVKANILESLKVQRNLIGAFVRASLMRMYGELQNSFEEMSYIKLEVLSNRKKAIYANYADSGKRGDIQYVKRNDKQYFWDFDSEFWADELGDYVFALRSECTQ